MRQQPERPLLVLRRPAADDPSDDDLMIQARDGEREALDTLVTRHHARMTRVASRLLQDPSAAADAVQNTFVELFGALTRYVACGKFKAYLYKLLLNQCRALWRRGRTERHVLSAVSVHRPLACEQLLERERRHDVERGLARLPEKQRSALLLRYTADLGYQEIADALEIPIGTVKSRIFEAMATLRDTLEDA